MNRSLPCFWTGSLMFLFGAAWMLLVQAASAGFINPITQHISYQGHVLQNGDPFSGEVPMAFRLWNEETGGGQSGPGITMSVEVADGLFKVDLDFGNPYGSEAQWLEVEINGQVLQPRQRIRAAPLALHALTAPITGTRWSISGNGIHYSSGNVGIGVADSEATLHVKTGFDPVTLPFVVEIGNDKRLFLHPNGGLRVGGNFLSAADAPPDLGLWVNGMSAFGSPVILADLGAPGSTPLCRNANNMIGSCGGENHPGPRTAVVRGTDGALIRSRGATSAVRLEEGFYRVYFDRDVSTCTYTATVGDHASALPPVGFATVAHADPASAGNPNAVHIRTFDAAGAQDDRGFHLMVYC